MGNTQEKEDEDDLEYEMIRKESIKLRQHVKVCQINIVCFGKTRKRKHHIYKIVEDIVERELSMHATWIDEDEEYLYPCIILFYVERKEHISDILKIEHEKLKRALIKTDRKPIILVISRSTEIQKNKVMWEEQFYTEKCHSVTVLLMHNFECVRNELFKETISQLKSYVETPSEPIANSQKQEKEPEAAPEVDFRGIEMEKTAKQEIQSETFLRSQEQSLQHQSKGQTQITKDVPGVSKKHHSLREQKDDYRSQKEEKVEIQPSYIEVNCSTNIPLTKKAFCSFLERQIPECSPIWFEHCQNLTGNYPCFVLCFALSRIADDISAVVKNLNALLGCKAMLIVIHNCSQTMKPEQLLTIYKNDKIDSFTNILYSNGVCYDCDINEKAKLQIREFMRRFKSKSD